MSKKTGRGGAVRAWIAKKNGLILKISAVLFALCYALTYLSGTSGNDAFMGTILAVLAAACLLPAIL